MSCQIERNKQVLGKEWRGDRCKFSRVANGLETLRQECLKILILKLQERPQLLARPRVYGVPALARMDSFKIHGCRHPRSVVRRARNIARNLAGFHQFRQ